MYIHRCIKAISIALLIFLIPTLSQALTVTNLNDAGPGSLRDAVAGTPPGGTVDFAVAGTIVLSSEIVIDKDITIQGPGANQLTVSGGDSTRVFHVTDGFNIKISHLRIADGFVLNIVRGGSAILIETDSLNMELSDCIVEDNTYRSNTNGGGGIVSVFTSNPALDYNLQINRCSFLNNSSENTSFVIGSGVLLSNGNLDLQVRDSLFKDNTIESLSSNGNGSVFFFSSRSDNVSFTNTTFDSNTSRGTSSSIGGAVGGGGIGNTFSCTNCTFYNNRAECTNTGCLAFGGAIGDGGGTPDTTEFYSCNFCTFKSNETVCDGGSCVIESDTVGNGGFADMEFSNSIFYADNPEDSCANFGLGSVTSLGYNIDNGNTCAGSGPGDKPFTDPDLSPLGLQDNGGPTPTIALLGTSPAIDMADPACPPPGTDQRGVTRPQMTSCDVGAYEFNVITRPIPTLSEWGLIAMAGVLGIIGLLAVRRKHSKIKT